MHADIQAHDIVHGGLAPRYALSDIHAHTHTHTRQKDRCTNTHKQQELGQTNQISLTIFAAYRRPHCLILNTTQAHPYYAHTTHTHTHKQENINAFLPRHPQTFARKGVNIHNFGRNTHTHAHLPIYLLPSLEHVNSWRSCASPQIHKLTAGLNEGVYILKT